jgi:hypothetical protein
VTCWKPRSPHQHIREFTLAEIDGMLADAGLASKRVSTRR